MSGTRVRRKLRFRLGYRDAVLLLVASFFAVGLARADVLDDIGTGALVLGDGQLAGDLDMSVRIRVIGMVAEVEVEQAFMNSTDQWQDGIYGFPLPETAAVHRMTLQVNGRLIEGEIRERQQARREFERARTEGRQASLVSQVRPNLFTTRVANIPPGDRVAVTLSYAQTVDYRSGRLSLRFPMAITPRFDGPAPTGTGPREVTLTVDLEPGFKVADIAATYHDIHFESRGRGYRIELVGGPPDQDFELVWEPVLQETPQAAFLTQRFENESYGLLMLMPPQPEYRSLQPRELVLVVDTSGSMEGASMAQARDSLIMAIGSLAETDRFNVIAFSSDAVPLFEQPVDATAAHVGKALGWLEGLEANGGTNMAPALGLALAGEPPQGFVRQVVFVTDGAVGNETELFAQIEQDLGPARLFTVGIGPAPNGYFMRKAAQFGRGSYEYVGDVEEVAERMDQLLSRLEHPVLTNVCAQWDGAVETYPRELPDLYLSEPMLVAARLDQRTGAVEVCGESEAKRWDQQLSFGAPGEGYAVATLWGRRKIESLMDELVLGADESLIRPQVLDVALRHRLVSRYTSFVAVDRTPQALQRPPHAVGGTSIPLPQTDAGTVMRSTLGLMLLLLGLIFRARMRNDP